MQYRICFEGEAPAFGDGWRGVAVLKIGRKWVSIMETGSGYKARLSKVVWDKLPKHVVRRNKLTGEVVF